MHFRPQALRIRLVQRGESLLGRLPEALAWWEYPYFALALVYAAEMVKNVFARLPVYTAVLHQHRSMQRRRLGGRCSCSDHQSVAYRRKAVRFGC